MEDRDPRATLGRLIADRGGDCASLSRLLGRNPAYIQQYLRRGTPRRLDERDRAVLARFFGVPETLLGGPPERAPAPVRPVPRLPLSASAGPGAAAADPRPVAGIRFPPETLRWMGVAADPASLSLIEVEGGSMAPTLLSGDEILVDHGDAGVRVRPGVYVVRLGDRLLVKRLVRDGKGFAIRSDNPEADPVEIDDPAAAEIVGRVIWVGRKL